MMRASQGKQEAAQEIIQEMGRESLIDYFRTRVESRESLSSRRALIEAYARLAQERAIPMLIKVMQDSDEPIDVRSVAIRELGSLGASSYVGILIELLREPQALLQVAVVDALSRTSDKQATGPIMHLLKSSEPSVVNAAATALISLNSTDAIPLLREVVNSNILNPFTREKVSEFINAVEQPLLDQVIPMTSNFVGRRELLDQINNALKKQGTVILQGMGGVGKTSLAQYYAKSVRTDYKFWLSCRESTDISELYSHLARQIASQGDKTALNYFIHTRYFDTKEFSQLLQRTLQKRDCFLVLDGFDEAIDNDALIEFVRSLRLQSNFKVLITSRTKVDLPQTTQIDLAGLSRAEAKELIRRSDVTLTEAEIERLMDVTGGLPLALTLTLNLVKEFGFAALEQGLTSNQEDLFRRVIGRVIGRLETKDMQALRVLAVFNSSMPFGEKKIQMLFESEGIDAAEETLMNLGKYNLVNVTGTICNMHPIIQQYFLSSMDSSELLRLHRKIGDYYLLASDYNRALYHFEQGNDLDKVATILFAHVRSLLNQGHAATVQQALSTALVNDDLTTKQKVSLFYTRGELSFFRGEYDEAREYYQNALYVAQEHKDKQLLAPIFHRIGELSQAIGAYAEALQFYQQSLMISEQLAAGPTTAIYNSTGNVRQLQGHYEEALECYQKSLLLSQKGKDTLNQLTAMFNLGTLAAERAEYREADAYYRQSLELARAISDRERESAILYNMGLLLYNSGNYVQAEALLQQSLDIARFLGHRQQQGFLLDSLGAIASNLGNFTQADSYLKQGLMIAREMGHLELQVRLLSNLGELAIERGEIHLAEPYLQEGLKMAREIRVPADEIQILSQFAFLSIQHGDYSQAQYYIETGLALSQSLGLPLQTNYLLSQEGERLLKLDRLEEAREVFDRVLSEARHLQVPSIQAIALYGLSRVFAQRGMISEAKTFGEGSLTILESSGARQAHEVADWLSSLTK
jgi:tetratricopeptide (TPR) repeat protein